MKFSVTKLVVILTFFTRQGLLSITLPALPTATSSITTAPESKPKPQPQANITAITGAILDKEGKPCANGLAIFFAGTKQILSGGVFKFDFKNFHKAKKIFILFGRNLEWNFEPSTKNVDKISSKTDNDILICSVEFKEVDQKPIFVFCKEPIKGYDDLPKKRCIIIPINPAFVDQDSLKTVELQAPSGVLTLPTIHLLASSADVDVSLKHEVDTSTLSSIGSEEWLCHETSSNLNKTITKPNSPGSVTGNRIYIKA